MHLGLIGFALVMFAIAYMVGIQKKVYLLNGFRSRKIKDKNWLPNTVGLYSAVIGVVMLYLGFRIDIYPEIVVPIVFVVMAMGYVAISMYIWLRYGYK